MQAKLNAKIKFLEKALVEAEEHLDEKELNIAIVHALSNTVSGANPMEFPGAQTIDLTMSQWELEIGITF